MHHRGGMVIGDDVGPVVGIGLRVVLLQERYVLGDFGIVFPGRVAGLLQESGGDEADRFVETGGLQSRTTACGVCLSRRAAGSAGSRRPGS